MNQDKAKSPKNRRAVYMRKESRTHQARRHAKLHRQNTARKSNTCSYGPQESVQRSVSHPSFCSCYPQASQDTAAENASQSCSSLRCCCWGPHVLTSSCSPLRQCVEIQNTYNLKFNQLNLKQREDTHTNTQTYIHTHTNIHRHNLCTHTYTHTTSTPPPSLGVNFLSLLC